MERSRRERGRERREREEERKEREEKRQSEGDIARDEEKKINWSHVLICCHSLVHTTTMNHLWFQSCE